MPAIVKIIVNAIRCQAAVRLVDVDVPTEKNCRCNDDTTPIAFHAMVPRSSNTVGVKREHGEALRAEAMAAPATVSGEQCPKRHWPRGREGRMALRPASQETCHQRELTGRGVPGGSSKAASIRHARHPSVP